MYTGGLALYCCTLILHVHTSRVSSNIIWKILVRACEVSSVLVQLLPGKYGYCGCLFVPPLLFGLSASESEVAASVACWSVSVGGYCTDMWRNWRLGLVVRLERWLDLDLVLGCILNPGVGKEMVVQTFVQRYF